MADPGASASSVPHGSVLLLLLLLLLLFRDVVMIVVRQVRRTVLVRV